MLPILMFLFPRENAYLPLIIKISIKCFFVCVSCLEFLSGRIAKCNLLLYLRHLIVKWFSFNYFACGIITLVWCVFFIFCLVVLVYLTHYTFAPFLAAKISSVLFSTLWQYSLLLLLYHHYAVLSPCDYLNYYHHR